MSSVGMPAVGSNLIAPSDGQGAGEPPVSRPGGEYQELARTVKAAGLLKRSPVSYAARLGLWSALLGGGWVLLVVIGNSWYQLLVAPYLAVVFVQLGFLGHDAGHHQVSESRRTNHLIGLLCATFGVGISFDYWVDKHQRHHNHPNHVGLDPDVDAAVLAWTAEQANARQGIPRVLARYQASLFFPLLLLEGLNLHVSSVRALRRQPPRLRLTEALLLAGHAGAYVSLLLLVSSPLHAAAFLLVQQGLFGLYLGCAFAPNHKGMRMLAPGEKLDFLLRQLLTSRNVSGGWLTHTALGGLNHQIEHHLFPTMPMANLRRAEPLVRAFCARYDLPYYESPLIASYQTALRSLHTAGTGVTQAA